LQDIFFSKSLHKFQSQRLRHLLTIPPTKGEQISQISTGQVEGKKKWRKLPTLHLKPLNCWANKLIYGRVMSGAPNRTQQNRTEHRRSNPISSPIVRMTGKCNCRAPKIKERNPKLETATGDGQIFALWVRRTCNVSRPEKLVNCNRKSLGNI